MAIAPSDVSLAGRQFNERTVTPYNYLEFPNDIVLLVVLWRVRYKLSLRDLAEMFLERGLEFTHKDVRDWGSTVRSTRSGQTLSQTQGTCRPLLAR